MSLPKVVVRSKRNNEGRMLKILTTIILIVIVIASIIIIIICIDFITYSCGSIEVHINVSISS